MSKGHVNHHQLETYPEQICIETNPDLLSYSKMKHTQGKNKEHFNKEKLGGA